MLRPQRRLIAVIITAEILKDRTRGSHHSHPRYTCQNRCVHPNKPGQQQRPEPIHIFPHQIHIVQPAMSATNARHRCWVLSKASSPLPSPGWLQESRKSRKGYWMTTILRKERCLSMNEVVPHPNPNASDSTVQHERRNRPAPPAPQLGRTDHQFPSGNRVMACSTRG